MMSFHIMLKWISLRLCVFSNFSDSSCCKFILWIWLGWSSILKFPKIASISDIQYLRKEVRDEIDFLHEIYIKVSTSWQYRFWWKWPRHVQSTQNRKVVIFLEYIKKMSQLLLCFIVMQNIQISFGGPVMYVVTY